MEARDSRLSRRSLRCFFLSSAAVVIAAGLLLAGASGTSADKYADINAAIKKAGAKWVARPTSAEALPAEALCGLIGEPALDPSKQPPPSPQGTEEELPAFWDWRTNGGHNWTTPIRNQGGCGSCYVFGAIATTETAMKVQAGPNGYLANPDLSEQATMACGGFLCTGGNSPMVYTFLRDTGAPDEACLPYQAIDTIPCSDACSDRVERSRKIIEFYYVDPEDDHPTDNQVKAAIKQYGACSAGLDVYEDFQSYSGGVYQHVTGEYVGGHLISLVGWDDSLQCWIGKNSWGTNWGETIGFQPYTPNTGDGGWFRIRYGDSGLWGAKYPVVSLPNLTHSKPSGWTYSLVPRSSTGATQTNCQLSSTLSGNLPSTYINFAGINDGSVSCPTYMISITVDGAVVRSERWPALPSGERFYGLDSGPRTIRGGRHTIGFELDSSDEVDETDESEDDNMTCRQFVWSPQPLSNDTPLTRTAPPIKDAWGNAPSASWNNDGFSFYAQGSGAERYWSAVGILPADSASYYDLRLWGIGDYQGSEQGFGDGEIAHSGAGGSACDFVVVNTRNAAPGTYFPGAINMNSGTGDYRIEEATSLPIYKRPTVVWNGPYSQPQSDVLDMYEIYLDPGDYGLILDQTSGACDLGVAFFDRSTVAATRYEAQYRDWNGPGEDEAIDVSISQGGYYGFAVFRSGAADYDQPCEYRVAAAETGIYLLSPNGGESCGVGEQVPVTWEEFGASGVSVKIELSRDGGGTWSTVDSVATNDGYYLWTVAGPVSTQCRVKVTSNSNPAYTDQSSSDFSIVSRSITVNSPNGGETCYQGDSMNITWSSSGFPGNVSVEISRDSGSTWSVIAGNTPNDGSYTWTVTGTVSNNCRIRISSIDYPTCKDVSNADFTISPRSITVTYPNTVLNWYCGDSEQITWTSTNMLGNVSVAITRDDGATWTAIALNISNLGMLSWTVVEPESNTCRIRVSSVSYPSITDTSDSAFGIKNKTITLTAPNGGETLGIGDQTSITWTPDPASGEARIELSRDGGATWSTLLDSTPNDGSEPWTVTGPISSQCRIRVSFVSDPAVSDSSDSSFTIASRSITVTSPNGGEFWVNGESRQITWTSENAGGTVSISISSNGGATWSGLSMSAPNTGSWPWTVGATPSETCKVKVVSHDYPAVLDQSDSNFAVLAVDDRAITVTSPNGGEKWCIGETGVVTWSGTHIGGDVTIWMTRDGVIWLNMGTAPFEDGSWSWTVAGKLSTQCRIRVHSEEYGDQDESDSVFSIVNSSVNVTTPAPGQTRTVGGSSSIYWTRCNIAGNVKIEISRDGGVHWSSIIDSTPNDGAHTWTVTGPDSAHCLIKITCLDDLNVWDVMDGEFSIVTRTLTVTSPNGGESWGVGQTRPITWTSTNLPAEADVTIEITRDWGGTLETIIGHTPNTGAYDWLVTGPTSTDCGIQITSTNWESVWDRSNSRFTISQTYAAPLNVSLLDWKPYMTGLQVTVEVRNPGQTTPIETHTAVLEWKGNSSIETTLEGTYDLAFKSSHWLREVVPSVALSPGMSRVTVSLVNGDCNNDNTVGQQDATIVTGFWAKQPPSNPNADLDGSGRCDVYDLAIVKKNWLVGGDR